MKNDIAILRRSFSLIFADPVKTLKVTAPGVALLVAGGLFIGADPVQSTIDQPIALNPGFTLLQVALWILGMLLIAICWHRYALLEDDRRDQVMRPGVSVVAHYFGRLIIVGLILIAATIPVTFLFLGVGGIASGGSVIILLIITAALGVVLSWVGMRISLTLPAAALGEQLKTIDSIEATRPLSMGIFRVAVILAVMNAMLASAVNTLADASVAAAIAGQLLLSYFQIVISISVLSTLYGHLIQHRPLT